MEKIFIFIALTSSSSYCLELQNRTDSHTQSISSEIILEFVSDGVYDLKVTLEDSVETFRLVKEKKDIEVLIAEDQEVINRIEHEVRKIVFTLSQSVLKF